MRHSAVISFLLFVVVGAAQLGCGSDDQFPVTGVGGGSTSVTSAAFAVSTGIPDPICGNGLIEVGEVCDDFNKVDISETDGCSPDCTFTTYLVGQSGDSTALQVQYLVDGLLQSGIVCIPLAGAPYPVMIMGHRGFAGFDGKYPTDLCSELDGTDFVRVYAQYRGEPWYGSVPGYGVDSMVSEGQVEVCLGEVRDAAALARGMLRHAAVDKEAVYAAGVDHGGCVALQLAARAKQLGLPPLRAVTTLAAPTDYIALYDHAQAGADGEPALADLVALLDQDAGMPGAPARNKARSALAQAGSLVASNTPILFMHDTDDTVVPLSQACLLHQEMRALGAEPVNVQLAGQDVITDPLAEPACAGVALEATMPPVLDGRYYFLPMAAVEPSTPDLYLQFLQTAIDFATAHPGPP